MTPTAARPGPPRTGERLRALGPGLVLLAIVAGVAVWAPGILAPRALAGFSVDAAPLLLLVFGASLPILLGGIDLSIAAMASLAGVMASLLTPSLGSAAVPVILAGAALVGALQGALHARLQMPSFVVSLGTLGILSGTALVVTDATALPIEPGYRLIDVLAERTAGVPNAVILVMVVWLALVLALRYLRFGRSVYAIGAAELPAMMSGVGRTRTRVLAYAASAACAALAGLLLVSQTLYSAPTLAQNLLLPAIVGVIVGGTAISGGVGGMGASLIGGLIAVAVRIGSVVLGFDPAVQNIVFGAVILVAVAATIDRGKIGVVK
ncbi:ABC transporter permease [Labrys wisconsinensis]|uniref:Autoinducer 2 import system permease protein LsrD n=1 Tax=Labrys wisconsinensis TaxID=425677 RepID=A0ABU0JLI8_9HYPH|nr:ABC transporter permease [Labrys wisconsinensis]MDQ0474002.1 ribose transport system permease protein [Labrys wisconsinensis]